MKKQNEKKNETKDEVAVAKPKRIRRERKFMLYVDGKGLIRLDREAGTMPGFTDGDILVYTSKTSALYAREFFTSINLAETIDIVSKVA